LHSLAGVWESGSQGAHAGGRDTRKCEISHLCKVWMDGFVAFDGILVCFAAKGLDGMQNALFI